jgi:RNA polymerase sigma-70 factor, ECF subfamily
MQEGAMSPFSPQESVANFESLLEQARGGNETAMGQLLECYREQLISQARSQLPQTLVPRKAPSDVVQDTLFTAYRHLGQFRGASEGEFQAWLRQILHNTLMDFVRACQREKRLVTREESLDPHSPRAQAILCAQGDVSPLDLLIRQETHAVVRACILDLSEEQQRVIRLHQGHPCRGVMSGGNLASPPRQRESSTFGRCQRSRIGCRLRELIGLALPNRVFCPAGNLKT